MVGISAVARQSYNRHEWQLPEKDRSTGAFGTPIQVFPVSISADHVCDWEMPRRCPILHLVGHHLLNRSNCRCNQCHFCRVVRQVVFVHVVRATYLDVNRHHYDNVQHWDDRKAQVGDNEATSDYVNFKQWHINVDSIVAHIEDHGSFLQQCKSLTLSIKNSSSRVLACLRWNWSLASKMSRPSEMMRIDPSIQMRYWCCLFNWSCFASTCSSGRCWTLSMFISQSSSRLKRST